LFSLFYDNCETKLSMFLSERSDAPYQGLRTKWATINKPFTKKQFTQHFCNKTIKNCYKTLNNPLFSLFYNNCETKLPMFLSERSDAPYQGLRTVRCVAMMNPYKVRRPPCGRAPIGVHRRSGSEQLLRNLFKNQSTQHFL